MLSTIQVSPGELVFRCDHVGLLLSKLELCINTASLSTIVRANQVFEFSDYLWALLISSSKVSSSFYGIIATSFSLILLISFTHNPISTRHLQLHNLYPIYISCLGCKSYYTQRYDSIGHTLNVKVALISSYIFA